MTDLILYSKPFDWNDNLSEEAIEDFERIQKDLPYCTCQNIGMALAKLELLEKQGCKVIDPSGSSSEKSNKCEDAISRYQKIKQMLYEFKEMPLAPCLMKGHICAVHEILNEAIEPSASSSEKPKSEWQQDHEILKAYSDGANDVLDKIKAEIKSKYESIPDTFHHYETGFTDALEWVLSIIDKYQAEGSDK